MGLDMSWFAVNKLEMVDICDISAEFSPVLMENERVVLGFKGIRDAVVFTDRRVLFMNRQGLTGKKTAYTTIPYTRIQAFELETAGTLDIDSEVKMWVAGLGAARLCFTPGTFIYGIGELLNEKCLNY
ncbi:PH domain-containing protein [Buchananella hordeovulneris]|nr:PH domain-containing protein [Buchananella hordeovulneris]